MRRLRRPTDPALSCSAWDVELAAAEIRRNAGAGSVPSPGRNPAWLGLPSPTRLLGPLLPCVEETGTVITMHIGSGTKTVKLVDDAPTIVTAAMISANSAASMIDSLFSVSFTVSHAEADVRHGLGWIPYYLERAATTTQPTCGPGRRTPSRAAVLLLPPPDLQLFLQGHRRHETAR